MMEDGTISYTVETGVTCHFNQESPDLGPFPRAWGTLAYINACRRERDDLTDSKYVPACGVTDA